MAEYFPPTEDLPTFDVLVFREANDVVPYATSSGATNQVKVQTDDSATPYYPLFSLSGAIPAGIARTLYNDPSPTPLSYVPSTSTLTATIFNGTASKVNLSNTASGTVNYMVFSTTNTGSSSLITENGVGAVYDSTTNTAAINITGQAGSINIVDDNSSGTYYPTFVSNTGQQTIYCDKTTTSLTYRPDIGQLTTETLYARDNSTVRNINIGGRNTFSSFFSTNDAGLPALTTGDFNVAIGGQNAQSLQGGSNNFSMGYNCMMGNINGSNNCLMGHRAGLSFGFSGLAPENSYNTAVGDSTMTNALNISEATCIGFAAGFSMLNNNLKCSCIGSLADCADGLSFATAIGAGSLVTTSNTVELGRAADNTNIQGTLSVTGTATFTAVPRTPTAPSIGDDLCNKTYVDALSPTQVRVQSINNATTYYPLFSLAGTTPTGTSRIIYNDPTTTTLSYRPDTGLLTTENFACRTREISIGTGFFGFGNVTSDYTNLVCGNSSSRIAFSANGCNTIYGSTIGTLMNVASQNNTIIGNNAGNQLTTGNNNTLVGKSAGDNIQGGNDNTLIGVLAGDLLAGGGSNTAVGVGALDVCISGSNNVAIGKDAGNTVTGSNNIVIGQNAQVPTAANSNQIAIGTASDTIYIRGGFNWRVGTQITSTATGNLATAGFVLAQFYTVAMTAAGQTITLPNPANAEYLGARVTFKRKTNTTAFTLTSTGGAGFVPIGAIGLSASPHTVAATVFQVDLVSDGTNWCIIGQA